MEIKMEENKKKETEKLNEGNPSQDFFPVNKKSNEVEKPMAQASPFIHKEDEKISEDVRNILKGIELPERRETKTLGDSDVEKPVDKKVFVNEEFSIKERQIPKTRQDLLRNEEKPIIPSMRTFKGDLQGIVKDKKMSLVKAATLENDKRRGQDAMVASNGAARSKSKSRVLAITFAIIVLIGLGGLAVLSIVAINGQRAQDVFVEEDNSFLFAEQTFTIPISGQKSRDLLNQLAEARQGVGLTLGAITRIVPTVLETNSGGQNSERQASVSEFLNSLGANTTEDLIRSFGSDFFLGIHTIDDNVPIIIIPILLYQNAFSGMLKWEENINQDLSPLFTKVSLQGKTADGSILLNKFDDVIIRNFDVRALRDRSGAIKMLYAFPTREILIIAESPLSFVESLARLRAERRL
jgi:hypothetical protein